MSEEWLGRYVRERSSGRIGKVTADLVEGEYDLLGVWFGPREWHRYEPNQWSKDHLFEVLDTEAGADLDTVRRAFSH